MPKDKIEIIKTKDGEYAWHRRAANGEIISQGETHPTKWGARRAAERANPEGCFLVDLTLSTGIDLPD